MTINGKDIYFDVEKQCFLEINEYEKFDKLEGRKKEVLELYKVTKEHIKREYAKDLKLVYENEIELLKELKNRIQKIYTLEIESVKLAFEPFQPKWWNEGEYKCRNLFEPTELWKKAHQARSRLKAIKTKELYNSIDFLVKYRHIHALMNNLMKDDYRRLEYFINWLASALITLRKNGTAIVFKGEQGTGKGVLYEQIIQPVVGEKYTYTFSNQDLKNNFNKNMMNKLFVVGNEIKGNFREGNSIYETLKMWVTDSDLRIEMKGIDAFNVKNYFNILIFSNHDTPLQIQAKDRRYTVFGTKNRKLINVAKEDFGYNSTADFIQGIRSELENFIIDLFCYDFDTVKARVPMYTFEKESIYYSSVSKAEIFGDAIKNKDFEYFENIIGEYVDFIKEEDFEFLVSKFKIPVIIDENGKKTATYYNVLDKLKNQIRNEGGEVANNILSFLFVLATNEQNAQKIGTALTALFGKSYSKRTNDNVVRVRKVIEEEDYPF